MPDMLRTEVGGQPALRQIRSPDGSKVLSTIKSAGGYRFVEEHNIYQPAGPGFDEYWFWRIEQESGIYSSEQEAFNSALSSLPWLKDLA
jgi:hypothetical protein